MTNYRRKKSKPKEPVKQFIINTRIHASTVRIINEAGDMVGIYSREDALKLADEQNMDLIEINPKAQPPVVKLIEYSKFKYQLDKSARSKPKTGDEVKTLMVSVRIATHDLQVQSRKADEFLKKGSKVRLQVRMKGRERSHPELAAELMTSFLALITEGYIIDSPAKLVGDSCLCSLKPKK
jgi:translation initiation factor IF-3